MTKKMTNKQGKKEANRILLTMALDIIKNTRLYLHDINIEKHQIILFYGNKKLKNRIVLTFLYSTLMGQEFMAHGLVARGQGGLHFGAGYFCGIEVGLKELRKCCVIACALYDHNVYTTKANSIELVKSIEEKLNKPTECWYSYT